MGRGDDLPKQFIEVGDAPILIHTLRRLQGCGAVDSIYLVSIQSWLDRARELAAEHGIDKLKAVLPGGGSALESIFFGLRRIVEDGTPDDAVVLIHDGVRPMLTDQLIRDNIALTRERGNAITSIPAFETVALRVADSDEVEQVVDRHRAWVLQAPQTFRLRDAYEVNVRAAAEGMLGRFVDQANMQRHYGHTLHLIEGYRGNVKITIPGDVEYFRFLFDSGRYDKLIGGETWEG
jgi:2-C-methyl-D-erythritol 4-phosphate cytidylyltransferase